MNRASAILCGWYIGWNTGKWYYPRAIKPYFDYYEQESYKKLNRGKSGGGSSSQPRYICFVAGTEVATLEGPRAIQQVEIGIRVLTKDFAKSSQVVSSVLMSGITGYASSLTEVCFQGECIRSTPTHPYWTRKGGWIEARNLTLTDLLENSDGDPVLIEAIRQIELVEPVPVYDIRISGHHWFFIGKSKVLVHNS